MSLLKPESNKDLSTLATMQLSAQASHFLSLDSAEQLPKVKQLAEQLALPIVLLGEGSNSLFTQSLDALVVQLNTLGMRVMEDEQDDVLLYAAAGEHWDDLVAYAVENDWYGIENLSWIPGAVGAAPIQNIGAYGVELSDVLEWVDVFEWESESFLRMSAEECQLAYRESIFKQHKQRWVITGIAIRLSKQLSLKTHYAALEDYLLSQNIDLQSISLKQLRQAVISVRQSKLPDPQTLPNAGSFFKNPIVTIDAYQALLKDFPKLPSYPVNDTHCKLPAAWLIDQLGWKGKRYPRVGVHEKQALVLVNHGGANGRELLQLANDIQTEVKQQFGIELEIEPRIYP